ncbi:HAMP domain-containing histidine kinase [Lysobacter sp. S4-A87]|uniref:sensor histidine kinase n=1 Tax=Lysobacter sp. S4-A87 TaxID=2925843 RepID=UPI001F53DAA1|nr:HAMP domain-containing sensor histidine kinase [Lysobacter sp. S4-A87]UNK50179.1 HAMP domain-containing histidine kinase [Lysobacter sp. S4-A87]
MSTPRSGLRRRILLGLLGYVVVLTVAVILHGFLVNEHAEQLVWQSLLDSELDHIRELSSKDPDYRWVDTSNIALFDGRNPADIPPALRTLEPGVHDDVMLDGIERVVLVRQVEGRPIMLALDITDLEQREFDMSLTVIGSAVTMIVLLGVAIAWSVNRLVRPLSNVAKDIARLQPDQAGQRIEVPETASGELVVIADALNDYLQRNDRFVERERTFIDSASHELRTPIAVIAGATEIALQQADVPAGTRGQLNRIQRTARDVEQLISLLLVLAKDPARLARISDRVELDQLLPEIVDDHRHLTQDKDLVLTVSALWPCEILAPLPIVQAAIGNLLRNAIEHSDRGEISIRLEAPATVVIDDPGHGMTPEEISEIYAKVARGGGERHGGGIGLDLISRLCEHLGWKLDIASDAGHGTTTTLRFVA